MWREGSSNLFWSSCLRETKKDGWILQEEEVLDDGSYEVLQRLQVLEFLAPSISIRLAVLLFLTLQQAHSTKT